MLLQRHDVRRNAVPGEHLCSAPMAPDEALPGPPIVHGRPHHKVPTRQALCQSSGTATAARAHCRQPATTQILWLAAKQRAAGLARQALQKPIAILQSSACGLSAKIHLHQSEQARVQHTRQLFRSSATQLWTRIPIYQLHGCCFEVPVQVSVSRSIHAAGCSVCRKAVGCAASHQEGT